MAPKRKSNKKGNDDWEADLAESPDPIAAAAQEGKEEEAAHVIADDGQGDGGGGGLLAALKKNKKQKQKKGKQVEEDYLEGEDPPGMNGGIGDGEPNGIDILAAKAPAEANADDLFDAPSTAKQQKGGKGKPGKPESTAKEDNEESGGEGGALKSKKEKEREKKEREKQRKKEQVRYGSSMLLHFPIGCTKLIYTFYRDSGC